MNFLLNKKSPQISLLIPSTLSKPVCVGSYFRYKSHIHSQQIHPLDSSFQIQKIGCQLFKNSLLPYFCGRKKVYRHLSKLIRTEWEHFNSLS